MAIDVEDLDHTADTFGGGVVDIDTRRVRRGLGGVVAFLVLWTAAALTQPSYVLPTPLAVAETFYAEAVSGALFVALGNSVLHWVPGAVFGTGLGIAAGIGLAWSPALDDVSSPVVRVLRPVPPLALIGFAIAWFGINHAGAAFIVAAGAFWINYYAAYGGMQSVSADLLDVARSLGVHSEVGLVTKVALPAAASEILTGVRTGIGRCWMLIIAAETIGVAGVGNRILTAASNLAVDVVIAYILVMSLVYLVLDTAFERVQDHLLGWRE